MPKALTHEEYVNKLKEKNIQIKPIEEYKKSNVPIYHQCLNEKCGHVWKSMPNTILTIAPHCPICHRREKVPGLEITRPDLINMLVDKRDGYRCTEHSSKKILWECPHCHKQIKSDVEHVSSKGLFCKYCSDGVSYPMKFVMSVLQQLNVSFETECVFKWAKFKYHNHTRKARYDIVFGNYIIEVDGRFHFSPHQKSNMSLDDVKFIDREKDRIAIENGYEVIRINCLISNKAYIKDSILKSNLSKIFDLNKIDWEECDKYASSSLLYYVCNLWNTTKEPSINKLINITGFSKSMIYNYLKRGCELNICSYDPMIEKEKNWTENKNKRCKSVSISVVCLNNKMIFNSLTEALNWCERKASTSIVKNCKGENQYAFTHPETKEKLQWAFYDDYLNMTEEDIKKRLLHEYTNKAYKTIICLDTNQIFNSLKEADDFYGMRNGYIFKLINNIKCSKKDIPKNWMYYEDYIKYKRQVI